MKLLKRAALVAVMTCFAMPAFAQGSDIYGKGMRIDLGDDKEKTRYIRFITWVQAWARGQEVGAPSPGVDNVSQGDILIRRARLLTYSQLTKDILVMFHAGINNMNFTNFRNDGSNGDFYVHDAWAEYTPIRSDILELSTGMGLHYWNGPVRQSSASTLNFLTLDAPISNWPLIEVQDQFARQLGFYIKGKALSKLIDYRMAINRPLNSSNALDGVGAPGPGQAAFNAGQPSNWGTQGYVNVQLFDKESNLLPYFVGTYLGKKRVFNIGAGWNHQKNVSSSINVDGDTDTHDLNIFGGDVFFDSPLGPGALTLYTSVYYADFGPNIVRNIGISSVFGTGFPTTGTGLVAVLETGYAFSAGPLSLTEESMIQPYYRIQLGVFDAFDDVSPVVEAGFNYFLHGHHAKFTLHWRARPVHTGSATIFEGGEFITTGGSLEGFLNEVIAQVQVYL
ncbi:MAG: hypothetical protein AAF627_06420 [Myxococcota bacterium]